MSRSLLVVISDIFPVLFTSDNTIVRRHDLGDGLDFRPKLLAHVADRVGRSGLAHHVGRPQIEGAEGHVETLPGQRADDDRRKGPVTHELFQKGEAVHVRHLDVEKKHIGFELHDLVAADDGVGRRADDLYGRIPGQLFREDLSHQGRIVDDEHLDGPFRRSHRLTSRADSMTERESSPVLLEKTTLRPLGNL
nr:hypothetical protein [Aminithiophilus ramosus]